MRLPLSLALFVLALLACDLERSMGFIELTDEVYVEEFQVESGYELTWRVQAPFRCDFRATLTSSHPKAARDSVFIWGGQPVDGQDCYGCTGAIVEGLSIDLKPGVQAVTVMGGDDYPAELRFEPISCTR
ncbi:MAG: hypothetical protein IPM16_22175 [Chloroflexi bacterium]|nr:hypothetical protein [Chloroflexota bacterium]